MDHSNKKKTFEATVEEMRRFSFSYVEKYAPLQRIGVPDEVAGAAILLASDSGSFITGQKIVMDGGVTISGGG